MNGPPGNDETAGSGQAAGGSGDLLRDHQHSTATAKRWELRLRKESTGAVVVFDSYTTFAEAKKVADRLVEIGCPVPILVELPENGSSQ